MLQGRGCSLDTFSLCFRGWIILRGLHEVAALRLQVGFTMVSPLLTTTDEGAIHLSVLNRAVSGSSRSRTMSVVSTVDINETCQFTEDTGLLQPPNNISTATTAIDNAPVQHDDTEDPQQQVPGSLEESPVAAISQRSLRTVVTIQAFMLLWLVPVVALLVLNFQGSIIGASAWCFRGDCNVDHFSATRNRHEEEQYSHDSRNLVGVLQVVAKALEVWFVFITFSLVFLATMSLAEHSRGLPNGYLTRAYQYADLSSLFERSLWKSFPLGRQKHDLHIQGYIICTILLCLLCTLMGPATAVMAIPTLQWRNTEVSSTDHEFRLSMN